VRARDVVQLTPEEVSRPAALQRLRAEPFVLALGASTGSPFNGVYPGFAAHTVGEGAHDAHVIPAGTAFSDAKVFDVLGIRLTHGRMFSPPEERSGAAVAVVSEATAAAFWPGQDPLGRYVALSIPPRGGSPRYERVRTAQVVGVVANAVSGWIGTGLERPVIYYPMSADSAGMALMAQVTGDVGVAKVNIDRDVSTVGEGAVYDLHTMNEFMSVQVWPFQLFSWLSSAIGAIALVLTLIGIYGVLAYLVAQRTREIGIRMALGASMAGVVGQVLRQSLRYALIGTAIGTAFALGVSQLVGTQLVIVDTFDVRGYAFGMGAVLLAAIMAAWAPSRRAAKINPMEALRTE